MPFPIQARSVLESQVCSYCLNIGQDPVNVTLTMHKLNIGKWLNIGKYWYGLKNLLGPVQQSKGPVKKGIMM